MVEGDQGKGDGTLNSNCIPFTERVRVVYYGSMVDWHLELMLERNLIAHERTFLEP